MTCVLYLRGNPAISSGCKQDNNVIHRPIHARRPSRIRRVPALVPSDHYLLTSRSRPGLLPYLTTGYVMNNAPSRWDLCVETCGSHWPLKQECKLYLNVRPGTRRIKYLYRLGYASSPSQVCCQYFLPLSLDYPPTCHSFLSLILPELLL
jgi:hypothetical protein